MALGIAIVAATTAYPQSDSSNLYTGTILNGRAWNIMPDGDKESYVLAVKDYLTLQIIREKPTDDNAPWARGFVGADYIRELNLLYKDGENLRIPIPLAFEYCTGKLRGDATKEGLENALIYLRKTIASWK